MRSILSILIGYILISALIFGTLLILETNVPGQFGVDVKTFPEAKWVSLVLMAGFFFAMIGGYVTSMMAKRNERMHAAALSIVIILLSLVSFRYETVLQPLWYKFGVIFSGVAGVMLGSYWFSIIQMIQRKSRN